MQEKLIRLVEKEYRLRVHDYTPLRKAWVLQTDRGPYFFKSFVFHDGPRLKFIDRAMRHLMQNDFSHIIPLERALSGEPYIQSGGDVYSLAPFLELRQCDYDKPKELTVAAELLAALHRASHGYRPPLAWNPQYFWGRWPRRLTEKIQHMYAFRAALAKKPEWDEFDRLYAEYYPYYFQQAKEAREELIASQYQRLMFREQQLHGFCHHDFEYHNVLISPTEEYYVIDFDYLLCDTHLHDLASLLIRAGKRSAWEEIRRERILEAYHQIYPLLPAEIPVIKAIMHFPQAFWQVGYARYFEKQPWPLERFTEVIQLKTAFEPERLRYIQNLHYPEGGGSL